MTMHKINAKDFRAFLLRSASDEAVRARNAEHMHQALVHSTREALLRELAEMVIFTDESGA